MSYAVNAVQKSFTLADNGEDIVASSIQYRQKITSSTKTSAATLLQRWWVLMQKRRRCESRLEEIRNFNTQFFKFAENRARNAKLNDPKLKDIVKSFNKDTTRELIKLNKHLDQLKDISLTVLLKQCIQLTRLNSKIEVDSTKYANVIRMLFDSFNPRRRASAVLSAFDPFSMRRRQVIRQRSKLAKSSTSAIKKMLRHLTSRSSRGSKEGYSSKEGNSSEESVLEVGSSQNESNIDEIQSPQNIRMSLFLSSRATNSPAEIN